MTKQTKKHNDVVPALAGLVGFLLIYWAVSIGDVRSQMPEEQAKTELPSKKEAFAYGASGAALLLGSIVWFAKGRKNGQGKDERE